MDANLMPVLRQVADERVSATGYGILNCTGCLAGGFMTLAGGVMRDRHIDLAFDLPGHRGRRGPAAGLILLTVRPAPRDRPALAVMWS